MFYEVPKCIIASIIASFFSLRKPNRTTGIAHVCSPYIHISSLKETVGSCIRSCCIAKISIGISNKLDTSGPSEMKLRRFPIRSLILLGELTTLLHVLEAEVT